MPPPSVVGGGFWPQIPVFQPLARSSPVLTRFWPLPAQPEDYPEAKHQTWPWPPVDECWRHEMESNPFPSGIRLFNHEQCSTEHDYNWYPRM